MTDLFASLVDRAFDRTPVLQRRQPALFEPAVDAAFSQQSKPENRSPLEEKEILVESTPSHEQQKPFLNNASHSPQSSLQLEEPVRQPVEARPARRRSIHNNPALQNFDVDPEPVSLASVREPQNVVSRNEPPSELQPSGVAKPEEITVVPPGRLETIFERRVEREIIKEYSTDKPVIKEVDTFIPANGQSKLPPDPESTQAKQSLRAEVKPLTPRDQTAIKPLIQQRPVTRRDPPPFVRAVAHAESKHPPKQPAPPIIQVTIGRVEVRATPKASAVKPRAAQPVSPRMSLDDYLRSRGKRN